MFSSSHFAPDFFGEHFRALDEIIIIKDALASGTMEILDLSKDDMDVFEIIISYLSMR